MFASIRLLFVVGVCCALASGCTQSEDDALAKARAEAEAAKAELERLKGAPPESEAEPKSDAVAAVESSGKSSEPTEPWAREWKVLANDSKHGWTPGEIGPKEGNRPPYEGAGKRPGILVLHPLRGAEPAKVGFRGDVPSDRPVLFVEAAGSVHGDTILR